MKSVLIAAAALVALPVAAHAAELKHFAATVAPGGQAPAFSTSVMAGNTLYISGTTDTDRATGKPPPDPKDGAKLAMNNIKAAVEAAGLTMDDVAWLQIFTSDLNYYAAFNEVYRTYFKGPLPARAFIGAGSLLGGAHFEIMGIAIKK